MLPLLLLSCLASAILGSDPAPVDVPSADYSIPSSIDLFLGRCTPPKLEPFLKRDQYESACASIMSKVTQIRIQPVTKRDWKVEVATLESRDALSLHFGANLTLRFGNRKEVERTIEGVTDEIDAVYEPLTSTKPATYNFSLTHSKDLFDFVAPDGALVYSIGNLNETVNIKTFWEALKLVDIHNATDSPSAEANASTGLSAGALAGIIIAALVALAMLCLAIRHLLLLRRRRLEGQLTLDRTDDPERRPTPPSRTPTERTPTGNKKMSREPNEITGTAPSGFTSTNGPGRTGFTGGRLSTPTIPTLPVPWPADAQSPK